MVQIVSVNFPLRSRLVIDRALGIEPSISFDRETNQITAMSVLPVTIK